MRLNITMLLFLLFICLFPAAFATIYDNKAISTSKSIDPVELTKEFYDHHAHEYLVNTSRENLVVQKLLAQHRQVFMHLIKESHYDVDENKDNDIIGTTDPNSHLSEKSLHDSPHPHVRRHMIRRRKTNGKIIDLGCGYGRDAQVFAQRMCFQVLGIDTSRCMLQLAQQRVSNAHFLQLDMRDIATVCLEGAMDGVWVCASIHHVPKEELPALLENILTIIKPGGILYVLLKQGIGETLQIDSRYDSEIPKFYAFYEIEEFERYLVQAGFEILEIVVDDFEQSHDKDSYTRGPFIHAFAKRPFSVKYQ